MKSIRRYLLLTLLPAFLIIIIAGGLMLYHSVRVLMLAQFDAALSTKTRSLATLTTWTPAGIDFDFADEIMPEFEKGADAEYFEIWIDGASVLARSRSLAGGDVALPEALGEAGSGARFWSAALPDGRPGRFAAMRFRPQPDVEDEAAGEAARARAGEAPLASVVVGRARRELDQPLHALLLGLLLAGAAITLALSLVVVRTVDRGMKPLERVGAAVASVDDATLSTRINAADVPQELRPVCVKLNQLLERLQAAFERERRFSSAAAHELRTPVTELRTAAEVALKWPDDPAAQAQAMRHIVEISQQMERMIEALLTLARSGRGAIEVQSEQMTLRPIVDSILQSKRDRAAEKGIVCRNDVADALHVNSDRVILSSILSNLLDNAVEYAPDGGRVAINASRVEHDGVNILVSNSNGALDADDVRRVFEPFWRKDAAHSDQSHCGLGMTLVRDLATAAGMRVDLTVNESSHEVEARLEIPGA